MEEFEQHVGVILRGFMDMNWKSHTFYFRGQKNEIMKLRSINFEIQSQCEFHRPFELWWSFRLLLLIGESFKYVFKL